MVRQVSERLSASVLRLLAICGIIAPILYTIVVFTLGVFRPSYCHRAQLLSELGEAGAPNAMIMNTAGFLLLGILLIAFALGLHRGINEGKGSKIGPALIAVEGGAYVAVAFFPCDPGCVPVSLSGVMHAWVSLIMGVGIILAPFFIAQRFKNDPRWKKYRLYTLVTGVVLVVFGVMFGFIMIKGWMGAIQRTVAGVSLLWIEVMAIKLLRLSIRSSA